jgi:SAM-dependent methyltransferase
MTPPAEMSGQHEEARQQSRESWGAVARGWYAQREELWKASRPVSEWMVRRLDPKPGDTVLELAAGLADTGLMAARLVGESGCVIVTDFTPEMVAAARRRAEELGVQNAEFRVLDAERMDLETDSVDGVLCRWAFMLMIDPPAALAETRRVLRPGGRLLSPSGLPANATRLSRSWAGYWNHKDIFRRPSLRPQAPSPWPIRGASESWWLEPASPNPR